MMRGTSTGTMIRILFVFWATFALYPAQQLEFGDIISVGRSHINGKPLYTHWALYVGKGPVEGLKGKKDDQDIFHITGVLNIKLSDCVFGKMGSNKYSKNNYLDKDKNGNGNEVKSKEEMIKKINELHHNCGRWNPLSHNCEHIATSIRYGFQHSEQKNTKAEKLMKRIQKKKDEKEKKKKKEKEIKAGKRSLMDLLDRDSSLAAAGA